MSMHRTDSLSHVSITGLLSGANKSLEVVNEVESEGEMKERKPDGERLGRDG